MVYDPTVTADKAQASLPGDALNASGRPADSPDFIQTKGYIDARRKKRPSMDSLGPELDIIKQQQTIRVRMFNAGPFWHTVNLGSPGTAVIPPCPPDKEYVEMITKLFNVEVEVYPKTRNAGAKRLYDDGRRIAVEILGEGRNQHKRNSKRQVGVFIAEGDVPTAKEVADARAMMTAYASEQVLQMDNMWDRDRKLAHDMFRPETFGACAKWLGLTGKQKPWLAQGQVSDAIKCPWCEESVSPNAALCRNCHQVVNQEAYQALRAKVVEPAPEQKPIKRI